MSLPIVNQKILVPLSSIMKDSDSIFIIPTFQRPFAWEKKQIEDLHEDIKNTMQIIKKAPNNIHYLAPIHLIPFKAGDISNPTLSAYLPDNDDIKDLLKSIDDSGTDFVNDMYQPLQAYFVIDGQQRLTTLHFVYHFLYSNAGNTTNPLYTTLQHGKVIPRLIQNPCDDHNYFATLLKNLNSLSKVPKPNTQAQRRMYKAVESITDWNDWSAKPLNDFAKFLYSFALKSLLIELEPNYGLTSFQTLNDRGKNLTSLEKFKSLLFEYDLNYNSGTLTHNIHTIFSNLYQVLDEGVITGLFPEGEAGDNLLMQYIFTYLRVGQNADNYWQSGERAYIELREEIITTPNKGNLLNGWLKAIKEVHDQLKHLNDCLSGKELTVRNPSFICSGRTIQEDYRIIIRSLGLSSRTIAVLLKFRTLYNAEWHDRFPMECICDPNLFQSLSDHINQIRGETQNNEIHRQIADINMPSCEENPSPCQCEYSMLQVAERIELLTWTRYNPKGKFTDKWNAVFGNSSYTANDAIISWYKWYYEDDFPRFVQDDINESVFRYILREYESSLNKGVNIHFDKDLTLEHIFPQNPNPKLLPMYNFGKRSIVDYERFINRIGNLTFVYQYQNTSLSNQMPETKASRYLHPVNQPEITRRVGSQLYPLKTNYPAYQDALRVRCTELAIFSLKRFFC